MIAILASSMISLAGALALPEGAASFETPGGGNGSAVAAHPVMVHAEATGPRALSDVVFSVAAANGWIVAYEDAPIRAPADLVDFQSGPGVVIQIPRTYTDSVDYDPVAGAAAAMASLVASHNKAGNPGTFEARTVGDVIDVVGIGAIDANGKYAAVTPLLDTKVTLALKARSIDDGIHEVLLQIEAATGASLLEAQEGQFADTSASAPEATSARELILQMLLEGQTRRTWELLHGANTSQWGFNTPVVIRSEPPSFFDDDPPPPFPPPPSRAQ